MKENKIPTWLLSLDPDDFEFIRKFVINSGSLKDLAKVYKVSYPTVRIRLNRVIEKVQLSVKEESEHFVTFIKKLAIEDRINLEDARLIIEKYNQEKEGNLNV